jgi:hypothetical protein
MGAARYVIDTVYGLDISLSYPSGEKRIFYLFI